MSRRAVALLDPPSPTSLGMVPFVTADEAGRLQVSGLAGAPAKSLEDADLDRLIDEGHAVEIDGLPLPAEADSTWVAGWCGDTFRKRAIEIAAPQPQLPLWSGAIQRRGVFWFAPAADVHVVLERWLERTASICFRAAEARPDLAELMEWVLPDRVETKAALWLTRASKKERGDELKWQVRVARDRGESVSARSLATRYAALVEHYRNPKVARRERGVFRDENSWQRDERQLTKVFMALSDGTRQEILRLLESHQRNVGEIVGNFNLSTPTISRHLTVLKAADLVIEKRRGQTVTYRLNSDALSESMRDFFGQFRSCQESFRL